MGIIHGTTRRLCCIGLPIIILTAKNTTGDIVHGLSIGADDYMPKPFAVEELFARISERLRHEKSDTPIG